MGINNREHARHNFAPGKWLKILRVGAPAKEFKMYKLFDISKGGISFLVHSATVFRRSDEFHILEVEGKVLSDPILTVVRYVKAHDEFGVDFKVGCEFIARKS